jgi:hypothetical protein
MRNENAAALDSESRIGCLDPESRTRCRMEELVERIRFIWRPEKISSMSRWVSESDGEISTAWWQPTSRQRASTSSHRRARCSVLEIPHRLATNSFAKVGRAFLFLHGFVGLLCIRLLCWWWDFVCFVDPCAFVCYSLSTKKCWVGWRGLVEERRLTDLSTLQVSGLQV